MKPRKYPESSQPTCLSRSTTFEKWLILKISKTTQAFSVAAAIILSLDNFNRNQSAREYSEHRKLVSQTIDSLSASASISSIASRGARLLKDLLAEEHNFNSKNWDGNRSSQKGQQMVIEGNPHTGERSLNVAAFVKKFCESDLPQPGNSPITISNMPLWLQQESSTSSTPGNHRTAGDYSAARDSDPYLTLHPNGSLPPYENIPDPGYQNPPTIRRHHESFATAFGQNFGDSFDVRSLNWFDDLLGLAPSNSI